MRIARLRAAASGRSATDGHWRLFDAGVLSHDGTPWFRVGMRVAAARFDTGGDALLLVSRDELIVLTITRKRAAFERRYRLAPLSSALSVGATLDQLPTALEPAQSRGR